MEWSGLFYSVDYSLLLGGINSLTQASGMFYSLEQHSYSSERTLSLFWVDSFIQGSLVFYPQSNS